MESLNVPELKAIAKEHNMKGFWKMRKDDLIAALQDIDILEEPVEVNEYKCQHGTRKYQCKECHGYQICERNRQRGIAKSVQVHKYVNTTD